MTRREWEAEKVSRCARLAQKIAELDERMRTLGPCQEKAQLRTERIELARMYDRARAETWENYHAG